MICIQNGALNKQLNHKMIVQNKIVIITFKTVWVPAIMLDSGKYSQIIHCPNELMLLCYLQQLTIV